MTTKFANPSVNPTITLTAYTENDVVGVGGPLEFDVSSLIVNGGLINQAILIDEDSQEETYRLFLFEALPTTINNGDAFVPTIDDLNKLVAVIDFATSSYVTVNSMDYCIVEDINNVFVTSTGKIYGYLVATDTPDMAKVDAITIRLYVVSEQ